MQLFALDQDQKLCLIHEALKHRDYFCCECGSLVRKRGGNRRQDHFYHLAPNENCRQNGKSLVHLQVQLYLEQLIGNGIVLEKRFPQIQRIADVCWEKEKLIFEIQCSPISIQEVDERNRAYRSLGYQVVWILHDARFNQKRISAAELFLEAQLHYYTNMSDQGEGMIYDQFHLLQGFNKKRQQGPFPVQIDRPVRQHSFNHPYLIQKYGKLCFEGDAGHLYLQNPAIYSVENEQVHPTRSYTKRIAGFGVKIYRTIFRTLLESVCGRSSL